MDSAPKAQKLKWNNWYLKVTGPILSILSAFMLIGAAIFLLRLRPWPFFGFLLIAFIIDASARWAKRHANELARQLSTISSPARTPNDKPKST
jgi:hypothetical protein